MFNKIKVETFDIKMVLLVFAEVDGLGNQYFVWQKLIGSFE